MTICFARYWCILASSSPLKAQSFQLGVSGKLQVESLQDAMIGTFGIASCEAKLQTFKTRISDTGAFSNPRSFISRVL